MKITGIDQNVYETSCLGCGIAGHELVPYGGIIYEDNDFVVCQDFEVPIDGFIIISTKYHMVSINDMTTTQKQNFIMLVDKCLKALKRIGIAEEFIMIQGERKDIHFHISLMPRQKFMEEKFGRIIANLKTIQDYAKNNMKTEENLSKIFDTVEKLRVEMNKK